MSDPITAYRRDLNNALFLKDVERERAEAAEAAREALLTDLQAEIDRLDPTGADLFHRARLDFRGRGWVDGVKTSRAVVRERLDAIIARYRGTE